MNPDEFREFGKAAIDYIAEYHEHIRDRPVLPSVKPGYLKSLIPESMPQEPDQWKDVLKDMDTVIMPGITHWHSPNFHSYYPTGISFPSIVGEMMSAGLGIIGFSWMASPACTELEMLMMDWMAKAMDLPNEFYNSSDGPGGGILQGSASEATLLGLLVAKEKMVRHVQQNSHEVSVQEIKSKLVCYTSDQANSSVEKAGILASVPMRLLATDEMGRLRGDTVKTAVKEDRKKGLIPCYVVATLGTTGTCVFDVLEEIGPVCKEEDIWLHVDAAYAGAALICPELRENMQGIQYADSLVINFHKWLRVNFDCSGMWFKCTSQVVEALSVERIYLQHQSEGVVPDLRNWQIPLGRRFRSLKLWYTLRLYGLSGLQDHIRTHVAQAKVFEEQLLEDPRFMLASPTSMGLVCFRLKGDNILTNKLLDELNTRRKIYMIPASLNDVFFLRLALCNPLTEEDIKSTVTEIKSAADAVVDSTELNKRANTSNVSLNGGSLMPVLKSRSPTNCINSDHAKNNRLGCKLNSNEECSLNNGLSTLHTNSPCFIHPAHS